MPPQHEIPTLSPAFALDEHRAVAHRRIDLNGVDVFYRESGRNDAPVILLPHGYPCSSFQFRHLMPALADRWRLVAPDFPGFGFSGTPEAFEYTFDGYADFLDAFTEALNLQSFAIYLHDYGSQIGLRLAMQRPERVTALLIQNGDIYADAFGDKYAFLLDYFADRTPERRAKLVEAVSEAGFREEFLNDVRPEIAVRIPPDLWKLHWPLMNTPQRREIALELMEGLEANMNWFPAVQAWLREAQPPTLIVWGPQDGYMPEKSGRAYLRDLPNAEFHLLDGGHWALETNLEEIVGLTRDFLSRVEQQRSQLERPTQPGSRSPIYYA
jgi:pimeloyl-ACP methyl ester carboxylesterase